MQMDFSSAYSHYSEPTNLRSMMHHWICLAQLVHEEQRAAFLESTNSGSAVSHCPVPGSRLLAMAR